MGEGGIFRGGQGEGGGNPWGVGVSMGGNRTSRGGGLKDNTSIV